MTDHEIEKLQEKLGSDYSVKRLNGAVAVELADIWEGVGFAECVADVKVDRYGKEIAKGQIYRIVDWFKREVIYIDKDELGWQSKHFKPSTEAAYVEQLKAKAHELYGEIKDGDRFDTSELGYKVTNIVDFMPEKGYKEGFDYQKQGDRLYYSNVLIYQQGKWAKKIERVRVEPLSSQWDENGNVSYDLAFAFKVTGTIVGMNNELIENHLAKCLEQYLNKNP